MFISIATYINEDLGARLQAGQELPVPLTINALADHYEVSFTPVRTALAQLTEQGLLVKTSNGRLSRAKPRENGNAEKPGEAELPELPQNSYALISNDLVGLSLKGEPVYLREEATAEKYNLSRSAVRNIFHRLAGSGMLDHIPRRGWRLRTFRQQDMQAFLEVREVMELKALELAWPHLVDDELQNMIDGNHLPESSNDVARIDNSLHAYIVDKADNIYIKNFFEQQSSYYDVLFDWEDQDHETATESVRQHRNILQALLNRDRRAARNALSYHIRHNHPVLDRL